MDGRLIAGATTARLTLGNIQASSSGRYLCQRAFQFFVFASSPARISRAPGNVTVAAGTPVTLHCNAEDGIYPPVSIMWMYQSVNRLGQATSKFTPLSQVNLSDSMMFGNGQVLRLDSAEVSDTGLFTCHATNTLGNVTATAKVTVHARKCMLYGFVYCGCHVFPLSRVSLGVVAYITVVIHSVL